MTTQQPPTEKFSPEAPKRRPLSIRETLSILVAGHIGVRKAAQRKEDFSRAKGVNIFLPRWLILALLYFAWC
jgi:hypothetical protein